MPSRPVMRISHSFPSNARTWGIPTRCGPNSSSISAMCRKRARISGGSASNSASASRINSTCHTISLSLFCYVCELLLAATAIPVGAPLLEWMPASLEIQTLTKHRLCGMAEALEPDASSHGDPSRYQPANVFGTGKRPVAPAQGREEKIAAAHEIALAQLDF